MQRTLRDWLREARELSRWDEWATSKMPLIFASMSYALIVRPAPLAQAAGLALVLCFYAMFGYMVNAWSDRAVDRAAGKPSALADLGPRKAGVLVAAVAALGVALALALLGQRPAALALMMLAYALAAAYSVPPLRFKERGAAGLVVSSVAQRALPAAIVFETLDAWDAAGMALCVLGGLVGLRYIVVHQILDREADLRTGVRTVATTHGEGFLRTVHERAIFPLEVLALLAASMLMSARIPAFAPAALLFAGWLATQWRVLPGDRPLRFTPVSYGVFADVYNFFFPVFLGVSVAFAHPQLWPVAVFNIAWHAGEFRRECCNARRLAGRWSWM